MTGRTTQKALIVDDDANNLQLLRVILVNAGFVVETAWNGRGALEMAREHLPDLIYLDVMMPGVSGIEVCQILKADPMTRDIPVVLVTGLADQETRAHAREAGADDFLTKPIDVIEVQVRARNLLNNAHEKRLVRETQEGG